MMQPKAHQRHCQLLASIFFGEKLPVDCPNEGNSSSTTPPEQTGDYFFAFGNTPPCPEGWQCRRYAFVCNPDGSIRWLYPIEARQPLFLRLYNSAGWRGRLFSTAFRVAFATGTHRLLQHGIVGVFSKEKNRIDHAREEENACEHAIFTGTVGANRKAIVLLRMPDGHDCFLKIPLTNSAAALVQNEYTRLASLESHVFERLRVPRVRRQHAGIVLSDIRPRRPLNSDRLTDLHLEAMMELTLQTRHITPTDQLQAWNNLHDNLHSLDPIPPTTLLNRSTVQRLSSNLQLMQSRLAEIDAWPSALAHGDFTPWNLYLSPNAVHLYDWELATPLPWLYDAFHFIFQTSILIRHDDWPTIRRELANLQSHPIVRDLLRTSPASYHELLGFYLLHNTAYYLPRYLLQNPLHTQAHWLVDTWAKAVEWWLQVDGTRAPDNAKSMGLPAAQP